MNMEKANEEVIKAVDNSQNTHTCMDLASTVGTVAKH